MIPVLFITYDRLAYTKQALESLLKTEHDIKIFIWDNGSQADTVEYLSQMLDIHKVKIDALVLNLHNEGINKAFNVFIKHYRDCKYIAKVDNDTIVQPDWLTKLFYIMEAHEELFTVGAFMQRPPSIVGGAPWTFQRWVDTNMSKNSISIRPIDKDITIDGYLAYNAYTGGTGVIIRTQIFHDKGLLFEKYPCLLGDWTTFQRLNFDGQNVAWYSGTVLKLLNIKEDGVSLNVDFPEYEEKLKIMRDEGNEWYSKVGGSEGVARFIEQNGGREKL